MELARLLAESGADVVMGNHVHCVQPLEWADTERGKRLIIYSLGNFFADQYDLSNPTPKTQYGMLVNVTVTLDAGVLALDADYMPTFSYRFYDTQSPTGLNYRLIPAWEYIGADERPDVFRDDAGWRRVEDAYNHVVKIAGEDVPVFSRS